LIQSLYLIPFIKDDHCIQIPSKSNQPCNLEEIKIDPKPVQSSTHFGITAEPCHQPIKFHIQPTAFQIKIRMKMFKPLRLPYLLNPYPLDYFEYLPRFSGENQILAERHLESFEDFVERFEIVHEDVIMRFFSKSLIRDAATWFKGLRTDSIGSWIDFSNTFVKYWGEYKSLDSYLADFYALKREQGEALPIFNRIFYSIYYDMPLEIRPTETTAMIYYVMAQHSDLVLLLLERKSSSLGQLFEDTKGVEENIYASRRIRGRDFFENMQAHEQEECQYTSDFGQEGKEYKADLEQQQAGEFILNCKSNSSVIADVSMDRYACKFYDQFAK
jgi:hypothetical protein